MARYTALLDACVLVPIVLADTLLRIAERELYRPLWSDRIVNEAKDAVAAIHPEITVDRIAKRFAAMDEAFEDAQIRGWERFEKRVILPDPDDRHVVAAALRGEANAIVTTNVRDYPADAVRPLSIEVVHPDEFLLDQLERAPRVVLEILREQAEHARNPHMPLIDLMARLDRSGVPDFADEVRRLI